MNELTLIKKRSLMETVVYNYLLDEWKHFLSMKNVSAKRLEFPMAAASGTVQYRQLFSGS